MRNEWTDEVKGERQRLEGSRLTDAQPNVGSSLLARRSLFTRFGVFDPKMKHRDVQEWITRVTAEGIVVESMPDVLVTRRIHQDNHSRRRGPEGTLELLEIARARLARRKQE
jgi:GT2 family glycosyltransferase